MERPRLRKAAVALGTEGSAPGEVATPNPSLDRILPAADDAGDDAVAAQTEIATGAAVPEPPVPSTEAQDAQPEATVAAVPGVASPRLRSSSLRVAKATQRETPVLRPDGLEAKVQRIMATRAKAAARVAARQETPVRVTPQGNLTIPTRAAVARVATIKDGIALGDLSLIGVSGRKGNRRVLLRTRNGAIVRAKLGSRVDGWTLAAIGPDTVSIARGGRRKLLRLPH